MAVTQIQDIIVPEVFNPYVMEQTTKMSVLTKSGIIERDPYFDVLALKGGATIKMPFFKDLTGASQVLSETNPIIPNKITTSQDIAVLHGRVNSWAVSDLAGMLSGSDPMSAIGQRLASYWAYEEQSMLLLTLKGVFADNIANDDGDHVHDISIADGDSATADNKVSANALIDAIYKMGDASNKITGIMMHSAIRQNLIKQNLIDTTPTNAQNIGWGTFFGKTVIESDDCPVEAGGTSGYIYTTYLFGNGAFAYGNGRVDVPTEIDRDPTVNTDFLFNRKAFILHPRGIKFTYTIVSDDFPTDGDLILATNWDRVYESKNMRMVALKTNG